MKDSASHSHPFDRLSRDLERALRLPLPGPRAQNLMAPRPRRDWPVGFDTSRVRQAAGLLLLVPHADRAAIVLTVRAETLDRHGGQVSMPGGVIELEESAEQAAVREAHEEIGLVPGGARLLGALSPIDITVSGFRLHPIVAVAARRPVFHPAPGEVARVLEVPIDELLAPERTTWQRITREGQTFEVPAFPHDGLQIWGATAMVLAEFLALLGWTGPGVPPGNVRADPARPEE